MRRARRVRSALEAGAGVASAGAGGAPFEEWRRAGPSTGSGRTVEGEARAASSSGSTDLGARRDPRELTRPGEDFGGVDRDDDALLGVEAAEDLVVGGHGGALAVLGAQ